MPDELAEVVAAQAEALAEGHHFARRDVRAAFGGAPAPARGRNEASRAGDRPGVASRLAAQAPDLGTEVFEGADELSDFRGGAAT